MRQVGWIMALLVMAACVPPQVENRGHVDMARKVVEITPGKSTKQDVVRALGSPSTVSNFGEETWYYIAARKEAVAFMRPEIKDQDVTQIIFDAEGTVAKVAQHNLEDRQNVAVVERTTPTEGHSLGFFEQILGNVGRFNKAGEGPPTSAGR